MPRVVAAVALLAAFLCLHGVARAADQPTADVVVRDAVTHRPVASARVVLRGPRLFVGYTDGTGVVHFDGLVSGVYAARVSRSGYVAASAENVDLSRPVPATIDVTLAPLSALKSIGSVVARSTIRVSSTELDASNPFVRLHASSLAGALESLGVSDGLAAFDGHDASQTEVTIDGVPVNAPGVGTDLRGLNVDLFNGASLSASAQNAVGGALNLTTLEPTLALQTSTNFAYGWPDRGLWRSWGRGTAGSVGWVISHASSGATGPLDGRSFLDGSGLRYVHDQAARGSGNLIKVRAPFSRSTSLTLTGLTGSTSSDDVCARFTSLVPCGVGPGNGSTFGTHVGIATLQSNLGDASISAAALHLRNVSSDDQSRRFVNGLPAPQSSSSLVDLDLVTLSWARPDAAGITSLRVNASRTSLRQRLSSAFSLTGGGSVSQETAGLSRNQHLGRRLDGTIDVGLMRDFQNSPFSSGGRLTWRPGGADTVSGSLLARGGGVAPIAVGQFRDPASLVYDCRDETVTTSAPAVKNGPGSVSRYALDWEHRSGTGRFTLGVSDEIQRNTVVSTLLNGSDVPADVLPASYLSAVQTFYGSSAACGVAKSLVPANFFVLQPVGGVNRRYTGIRLDFSRQVGNVVFGGYARYLRAVASNDAPILAAASSVTVPGRQLPNIPALRGGVVADVRPRAHGLELLGLMQYVGSNNESNLPPYLTASAGASADFARGQLTLAGTNLTNRYASAFTSFAYGTTLMRRDGGLLPVPSAPLPPRSFSLTYSIRTGGAARTSVAASEIDGRQRTPSVRYGSLPAVAPENPYALDRTDPNCTPEQIASASSLAEAVKASSRALERVRIAAGRYPSEYVPPPAAGFDGAVIYVPAADRASYALLIEPRRNNVLGIACLTFAAAGEAAQAAALGIVMSDAAKRPINFYFAPRFGFYVIFGAGTVVSNVTKGAQRPAGVNPLDVRASCPAAQRPLVTEVVSALASERPRTLPSGVRLVRRSTEGGWTIIEFPDPIAEAVFVGCAYVDEVASDQLPRNYSGNSVIYWKGRLLQRR